MTICWFCQSASIRPSLVKISFGKPPCLQCSTVKLHGNKPRLVLGMCQLEQGHWQSPTSWIQWSVPVWARNPNCKDVLGEVSWKLRPPLPPKGVKWGDSKSSSGWCSRKTGGLELVHPLCFYKKESLKVLGEITM